MYYIYFLTCHDQSIYCGITTDLDRRITEHNESKKGAKYTRSRRPVKLSWYTTRDTKSEALRLEYQLKQLKRKDKLALCLSPDNPVLTQSSK
jgi:putative endonuclease